MPHWTVVVAQWADRLIPKSEDHGSNSVVGYLMKNIDKLETALKKFWPGMGPL